MEIKDLSKVKKTSDLVRELRREIRKQNRIELNIIELNEKLEKQKVKIQDLERDLGV